MPERLIRWDMDHLIEQVRSVCEITPDGCWLWRYGTWAEHRYVDEHKYPKIVVNGVRKHASRFVLEAYEGRPQPRGTEPCHSCDRPPCVNPEHLHWGTHKRNMEEMAARRRSGPTQHPEAQKWGPDHAFRRDPSRIPRGPKPGNYASGDEHFTRRNPELITWKGEAHYRARLNPDKVRQIRARKAAGERADDIADSLGVGRGTVRAVLEGRTWKHVA